MEQSYYSFHYLDVKTVFLQKTVLPVRDKRNERVLIETTF